MLPAGPRDIRTRTNSKDLNVVTSPEVAPASTIAYDPCWHDLAVLPFLVP
jgi:hypothetical protein